MTLSKHLAQWNSEDPELAYALSSRHYYDEGVFRREVEAIFKPAWHFAGHRSEVKKPGDFIKVDVLDQSVLVIRGRDGVVRAFHNVCQHRGTRLVDERRGKINRMIQCPYHGWCYEMDGKLRHAPNSESIKGFDPSVVSLQPVQVEEVSTFLFINLDVNAAPMRDEVEGSHEVISRHFPDLEYLELVEE